MCTLSWQLNDASLEILFNRDEQHSRPPAQPPEIQTIKGVRVLAPLDPPSGGTWLATNEHGLTLCLLNNYSGRPVMNDAATRSRGKLVRDLAALDSLEAVHRELAALQPEQHQPFFLLAFKGRSTPLKWRWDGQAINPEGTPECPVSTSSLYPRLVPKLRHYYYRLATRNGLKAFTPEQQLSFHSSQRPWPPSFAVAMSRPDRGTVSLTRIRLGARETIMDYWHGNPAADPVQAPSQLLSHQ